MSFRRIFSRSFRDMLHRKDFYAVFTASVTVFCVAAVLDFYVYLFGQDVMFLDPAWSYWGAFGSWGSGSHVHAHFIQWATDLFVIMLLPFLSSFSCAGCYFDQSRSGILKALMPRTGRKNYFLANYLTAFLGGFLVIFIPLAITQGILCAALPLHSSFNTIAYSAVTDEGPSRYLLLRSIYLNHPYLYNLLWSLIPALAGGCFAMISLSVSLFYRKNRLLILALPGIVWILIWYLSPNLPGRPGDFVSLLSPDNQFRSPGPALLILFAVLLVIPLVALLVKLRFKKDEL